MKQYTGRELVEIALRAAARQEEEREQRAAEEATPVWDANRMALLVTDDTPARVWK